MPSEFHRQLADLSYDLVEIMHGEATMSLPGEMGKRVEGFLLRHQHEIQGLDRLALKNLAAQLRLSGLENDASVFELIENLYKQVGCGAFAAQRHSVQTRVQAVPAADPTRLSLEGCFDVTDEALFALSRWSDWARLEKLSLHLCTEVTDRGVAALAYSSQLTRLVELALGGCLLITDHGIAELVHGKREWRSLDLSNLMQISDASLGFIAHAQACRKLLRLRLFGTKHITDKGLHLLANAPGLQNLRELDLGGGLFQLSEQGLLSLAELKSLEKLSLKECSGVSDKVLTMLATLPKLRWIDLADCPAISLEGLQAVAHLELTGQ